jgi:hypothetical protein
LPRREIATSTLLIGHAILVGLTPLVPIPILDDRLRSYFERRLAREIAARHGITLGEDDLRMIGEGPGQDFWAELRRGTLLLPVRLLLRKIFLFLNIKRASDAASTAYNRGYLLDVALAAKAHPPHRRAEELRAAIDGTLVDTPHSPVGTAVRLSFEGSKALLRQALSAFVGVLGRVGGASEDVDLVQAVGAQRRDVFAALVERVREAIEAVPAAHFQALDERLLARLAARQGASDASATLS